MPKPKKLIDKVILTSSSSVIAGHLNTRVPLSAITGKNKNNPVEVIKNGLFDAAAPNYTTFYPDVTADDLYLKNQI